MTCSAVLGVVVLGVLAGVIATRGGARRLSPVTPSSPTTVDARAFQGHGVLAFVSKGSLYLLNGATGRLVHLADPGYAPSDPTLSHDGRWLAYQQEAGGPGPGGAESSHGGDANYQLWIARSNGTDAHRVTSLVNSEIVGWSPSRDVLAVIGLPPQDWTCRSKALTTSVALVTPAGASRTVYKLGNSCRNPRGFYGAVWSPDGKSLAVSTTHFKMSGGSQVVAIDLATGAQRTWFSIRNSQGLPGVCNKGCVPDEIIPDLAGWWPNRGIGFWVFSNGMTHNNDGSPLEVVRAPGAKPEKLGETLSNGTDIAVAASRSGELAIARAAWRDVGMGGTEVQVCAPGVAPCCGCSGRVGLEAARVVPLPRAPPVQLLLPAAEGRLARQRRVARPGLVAERLAARVRARPRRAAGLQPDRSVARLSPPVPLLTHNPHGTGGGRHRWRICPAVVGGRKEHPLRLPRQPLAAERQIGPQRQDRRSIVRRRELRRGL